MRTEDTSPEYHEMPAWDLVDALRVFVRLDSAPPMDLVAALMGYGYDVGALVRDIEHFPADHLVASY